MMRLHSVLVTGANRGIGLELVKQLVSSHEAPEFVFATYRNTDTRKELKALREDPATKSTLYLIKLDVTKKSDIEGAKKIIEDLVGKKGLTLLINNAGFSSSQPKSFPNITEESLNTHFSINAVGPIMVFQTMLPLLQKAASASSEKGMSFSKAAVLNISSGAGSIAAVGTYPIFDIFAGYKISKAALNMAMRVAAQKVREHGVLVVNMCPGPVRTDMIRQLFDENRSAEEVLQMEELQKAVEAMEVQEPELSVSRILKAVESMNEANHGTFVNHFGETFPY